LFTDLTGRSRGQESETGTCGNDSWGGNAVKLNKQEEGLREYLSGKLWGVLFGAGEATIGAWQYFLREQRAKEFGQTAGVVEMV
jgi:hypothetical protein